MDPGPVVVDSLEKADYLKLPRSSGFPRRRRFIKGDTWAR